MRTGKEVHVLSRDMGFLIGYESNAQLFSYSKSWELQKEEQELFLNSITAENQDEYLAEKATPYWNMTYDEQLEKKQNGCSAIIDMIVKSSDNLKNLMTYKILPIVPSPVTKAYRNNDEFHIRKGVDGNPKTVGCLLGKVSLGDALTIRPTNLVSIKESHKRVAQVFEDFIRLSPLPANTKPYDGGHWSRLLVRSNQAGEVMACVTVLSKGYNYNIIKEQQQALKDYFYEHLPYLSLFHQVCPTKRCTHEIAPFVRLIGKRYFMETLNGYKFKILPHTIFPNNKLGSEVFYDSIIRTAKPKLNTTVLDICSGTGRNSIMVSRFVKESYGFDTVETMIKEAQGIAQFNRIHNVKFMLGRVDNQLNAVLKRLNESSDVVALLNHRRGGLGSDLIETIRRAVKISRIVYLFYKPNSQNALKNFVDLCSTKNSNVPPFRLTKVIPVDLFPQTAYVEIILLFERESIANI